MVGLSAKQDFHRSLLQDDKGIDGLNAMPNLPTDPRLGLPSPHHVQHQSSSVTSGKFILYYSC